MPKPGYRTTEFWLSLLAGLLGALLASGALDGGGALSQAVGAVVAVVAVLAAAGYTGWRTTLKRHSLRAGPLAHEWERLRRVEFGAPPDPSSPSTEVEDRTSRHEVIVQSDAVTMEDNEDAYHEHLVKNLIEQRERRAGVQRRRQSGRARLGAVALLAIVLLIGSTLALAGCQTTARAAQGILSPIVVRVQGVDGRPATIGAESGMSSRYIAVRGVADAHIVVGVVYSGISIQVLDLKYNGDYAPHAWRLVIGDGGDDREWLSVVSVPWEEAAAPLGLITPEASPERALDPPPAAPRSVPLPRRD